MGANGWRIDQVLTGTEAKAYDDIVLIPGLGLLQAGEQVDLRASVTNSVTLQVPLVSVDCATADAAIALACAGGLGVIHQHQTLDKQVAAIKRVRGYMCNFILEPPSLSPLDTVADFERLQKEIGRSGVCVTDTGNLGGKLLGVMSASDAENVEDKQQHLSKVMSTQVRVGQEPISLHEARKLMCTGKVGKLPIVNSSMQLVGMVSRQDFKKAKLYPMASRDDNGQLLVGAAVSAGVKDDFNRAKVLIEAGAMVLYVDIASCEKDYHTDFIKRLKQEYPSIDIIVGKVASCRHVKRCCEAGADAVVIGSADGDAKLPTSDALADASTVFELAKYARLNYGVPAIAEGSLLSPGQVLKALCLGACAVAPGRSLGPTGSEQASAEYLADRVREGMEELGVKTIPQLHDALLQGELQTPYSSVVGA